MEIYGTIGPSCEGVEVLVKMFRTGISINMPTLTKEDRENIKMAKSLWGDRGDAALCMGKM